MAPASAQGPFYLTPDDRRHELVLCHGRSVWPSGLPTIPAPPWCSDARPESKGLFWMATPSGVRGANTTSPDQYEALPSRCRRGHDVIVPGRNAICIAPAVILTACGAHE